MRKLKCGEQGCLNYDRDTAGCRFQWVEEPPTPPRGFMTRAYCPQFMEQVGDEIHVTMNAYN